MPRFDIILTRTVVQHAVILDIDAPTEETAKMHALQEYPLVSADWYLCAIVSDPEIFFTSLQKGTPTPKEPA